MQQLMQECSPEPKFKIACSCIHSVLITIHNKNRVENIFQAFSWLLTSRQPVFVAYLGSQLVSRFPATLVRGWYCQYLTVGAAAVMLFVGFWDGCQNDQWKWWKFRKELESLTRIKKVLLLVEFALVLHPRASNTHTGLNSIDRTKTVIKYFFLQTSVTIEL